MAAYTAREASKEKKTSWTSACPRAAPRLPGRQSPLRIDGGPPPAPAPQMTTSSRRSTASSRATWRLGADAPVRKAGGRVRLRGRARSKPRHRTIDIVRAGLVAGAPSAQRVEAETVVRIPSFNAAAARSGRFSSCSTARARAHPRRAEQRDRHVRRGRARRLAVRRRGTARRAEGLQDRVEAFRPNPASASTSAPVVLVDSGLAGPPDSSRSALREATVRTASSPKLVRDDKRRTTTTRWTSIGTETPKGVEKLPCGSWARRSSAWGSRPSLKLSERRSLKPLGRKGPHAQPARRHARGLQPDDRVFTARPTRRRARVT